MQSRVEEAATKKCVDIIVRRQLHAHIVILQQKGRMLELLKWQGYENVGFKTVDENEEEYIMVCEL